MTIFLILDITNYKYISGPDRAYFCISAQTEGEQIDEIEEYWNGCYHSATEATW